MSKREDILKAATRLFAAKGYQDTSIADISKATGAADGTIFYHFKNKEDILITILRGIRERILSAHAAKEGAQGSGLARVEEEITFYLALSQEMEWEFRLLYHNYPYQLAGANPEARSDLEAAHTCFIGVLAEAIRAGKADGSVKPIPEDATAMVLYCLVSGFIRFSLLNIFPMAPVFPEILRACRAILVHDKGDFHA